MFFMPKTINQIKIFSQMTSATPQKIFLPKNKTKKTNKQKLEEKYLLTWTQRIYQMACYPECIHVSVKMLFQYLYLHMPTYLRE